MGCLSKKLIKAESSCKTGPADLREMKAFIDGHRTLTTPFDIIWEGESPGDNPEQAADIVRPWAEAGATWWMEARWGQGVTLEDLRTRIRQGPPRIGGGRAPRRGGPPPPPRT